MNRDGDDFWLTIDGLTPQQEYRFQYLVDGVIKIADPYTEKVSSPFDDGQIIDENRYPGLQPYPKPKPAKPFLICKRVKRTMIGQRRITCAPPNGFGHL